MFYQASLDPGRRPKEKGVDAGFAAEVRSDVLLCNLSITRSMHSEDLIVDMATLASASMSVWCFI